MIELLWILVYAAIFAIILHIVLWALTAIIGIAFPARIVQLIWVVFALIVLIWVLSALLGHGPPLRIR
jgi:hypothetical protein